MAKKKSQPIQNASEIIERFGGIRPMAAKIDTPVTTVQGWKKRNVIPAARRDQILAAAQDNNIDLGDISETSTTLQSTSPAVKKTSSKPKSKPSKASDKKINNLQKHDVDKKTKSDNTVNPKVIVATPSAKDETAQAQTDTVIKNTDASANKTQHSKIMEEIDKNNQKAIISSIWVTVFLVLVGLALALFLLWPLLKKEAEEINPNMVQKIEQLETKVNTVEKRTSFIGNIIPEDLKEKISGLQEQAQNIQTTVSNMGDISTQVFGKDAGPLSNRLEVLEQKVAMLSNSENFNALIDRVQELENTISGQERLKDTVAQLQNMVMNQNPNNLNISLDNDLAEIRNQNEGPLGETLQGVSGNDLKAAAMLLAFSKFRDSLNREEGFEEDLILLQKLAGEDNQELQSALNRLAPKAKTGVLSPKGLSEELRSATGEIVFSSLQGEDVSIKEKTVARINNVFQVEKEGEPILGTETQLTVARAQKLLDEGNIDQAVRELRTLDGDAGLTAQDFIREAQSTLMAQQAQELISDSILSKVTNIDLNQLNNGNLIKDFDLDAIKRNLNQALPAISGGNQGVRDEASGLTILPNAQTFKGFSGGQNNPQE